MSNRVLGAAGREFDASGLWSKERPLPERSGVNAG